MDLVTSLRRSWKVWLVFLTPVALSSLVITSGTQVSKCAFMMGVCTVYWMTEALPLPITSLLPLAMAPLFGVLSSDEVCKIFFNDLHLLVVGVIFVGAGVEDSNLHRRIALRLLLLIGTQPRRLLFSIVSITGFLSMWISNTASTSMMAPIVQNLLTGLIEARRVIAPSLGGDAGLMKMVAGDSEKDENILTTKSDDEHDHVKENKEDESKEQEELVGIKSDEERKWRKTIKLFNLAVCYSANVGGIATLLGTFPNVVMANAVSDLANDGSSPINYVSWMKFGMPVSLFSLVLAFIWMNVALFGVKNTIMCKTIGTRNEARQLREVILNEYDSLGIMSFHEKVVLGHFIALILLFFTRSPGFVTGWASFFPPKYVSDGLVATAVAISLFIWPKSRPRVFCSREFQEIDKNNKVSHEAALKWKTTANKTPWGVLFLLGGGFVLAQASKSSGLTSVVAEYLSFVSTLPTWLTVLILTFLTCLVTEITSNTVITIILMPILGKLAMKFRVNPLLYMLPVTASSSMAFMLPVATPPNAIIFSLGGVRMVDMITSGVTMNLLGIFSINIILNTVGFWAFSLDEFPSWITHIDDVINNMTMAINGSTAI